MQFLLEIIIQLVVQIVGEYLFNKYHKISLILWGSLSLLIFISLFIVHSSWEVILLGTLLGGLLGSITILLIMFSIEKWRLARK